MARTKRNVLAKKAAAAATRSVQKTPKAKRQARPKAGLGWVGGNWEHLVCEWVTSGCTGQWLEGTY